MDRIIMITGKVKHPITLDPSVWIFDDRRIELTAYFSGQMVETDEEEAYKKAVSKHWDREIMEGATMPPTLKTEKWYEKQRMLTESFGISLKPFLLNSEPSENAETFLISSKDGDREVPLAEAYNLILGFSHKGKPLYEDGPVHVYFEDGSNSESPIKNVTGFVIK